jgi:hypothetical protein
MDDEKVAAIKPHHRAIFPKMADILHYYKEASHNDLGGRLRNYD